MKEVQVLAKKMADIFVKDYINECGFDNFKDMARCYGYDLSDIKDEVCANMINCCFTDDEGNITANDGSEANYKSFINMVYSELKKMNKYDY